MNSEGQSEDASDSHQRELPVAGAGQRVGGVDRRSSSLKWVFLIVVITSVALAGTVAAKMAASESPAIETVALNTVIATHPGRSSTRAVTVQRTAAGITAPRQEGGPAILWLVALAVMAVLWLGRRNDGGI